jgi:hypothetical protein
MKRILSLLIIIAGCFSVQAQTPEELIQKI